MNLQKVQQCQEETNAAVNSLQKHQTRWQQNGWRRSASILTRNHSEEAPIVKLTGNDTEPDVWCDFNSQNKIKWHMLRKGEVTYDSFCASFRQKKVGCLSSWWVSPEPSYPEGNIAKVKQVIGIRIQNFGGTGLGLGWETGVPRDVSGCHVFVHMDHSGRYLT